MKEGGGLYHKPSGSAPFCGLKLSPPLLLPGIHKGVLHWCWDLGACRAQVRGCSSLLSPCPQAGSLFQCFSTEDLGSVCIWRVRGGWSTSWCAARPCSSAVLAVKVGCRKPSWCCMASINMPQLSWGLRSCCTCMIFATQKYHKNTSQNGVCYELLPEMCLPHRSVIFISVSLFGVIPWPHKVAFALGSGVGSRHWAWFYLWLAGELLLALYCWFLIFNEHGTSSLLPFAWHISLACKLFMVQGLPPSFCLFVY